MTNENWSLDLELKLMIKYNLTAHELLTVKLIFLSQDGDSSYLNTYFTSGVSAKLKDTLISLQSKSIINKSYVIPKDGEKFIPNDVEFNQLFINSYLQHSNDLGMELFMAYPIFMTIDGKNYSLKNVTKSFKSLEDFCFAYGKAIKFNKEKHKEVLELLEYGKEINYIRFNICEFVISQKWHEIKQLRNEGLDSFNTSELL